MRSFLVLLMSALCLPSVAKDTRNDSKLIPNERIFDKLKVDGLPICVSNHNALAFCQRNGHLKNPKVLKVIELKSAKICIFNNENSAAWEVNFEPQMEVLNTV